MELTPFVVVVVVVVAAAAVVVVQSGKSKLVENPITVIGISTKHDDFMVPI